VEKKEDFILTYQTITLELNGPVALVTLNRPEKLNAINALMQAEFTDCFARFAQDIETRVIVLTGAGRGFCAGLDLSDAALLLPEEGYGPDLAYKNQKRFSDMILLMRRCPQPIIAAVNGPAAGGGFSFAIASDVRLASPKAKFGAAYINIGVGGADMGSSWFFPRLVGLGNASRYLLTGDLFDAQRAYEMGLVQEIIPEDALVERALALAQVMASKSPLGLALTKEALNVNPAGASLEDAIKLEDRNQSLCIVQMAANLQK
jgi:enoyl-CoA hydratase